MSKKTQVNVSKIHTYTGHKDAVYALAPGINEHTFYSSGGDGQVIEWDLNNFESGRLIAKIQASVYALHFHIQKNILIIGQNYEGIHLINVKDLTETGSLQLTKNAIFDIKVYKNLIIVAAGSGELFFVDIDTLQIVKRSIIAEKNLRTLLIASNEKCFVGTSDGQIIQINLETLNIEKEIKAHDNSVFTLRSTPENNEIVSGSRDARMKFWKVVDLILDETINAHMYAINDIAFHPYSPYFASASMDKTIKIWDYRQRKLIKVIDKSRHGGHLVSVNKLLWTGFNELLISCSDDRSISVWHLVIEK